ncbi:hypothetical protein Sdia_52370 [Streptomyces diastaticus subsp. diastaticus]|uniref:STAS domain-containing protein n=1 Tax=Streptomyces diastaticus subsp. diastaticus TaxID=68040 RepID=A0ABQ1CW56_STRDI|nr:hypothetical protein Sdia_52370 [Streptomyces diastaticus subsp. diastaticus]GGU03197.1 hypothetical protein GCM10015534_01060 [Streptomyces diastaticus subsp. diastaticus]
MAGQFPRDALRGGDVADAGPQFPDVDAAEAVAEDLDRARGGEGGRAHEAQDAGLPGTVGAEQRPVLAGPDGSVDAVEDRLARGVARHARAVERGDDAPAPVAGGPVHGGPSFPREPTAQDSCTPHPPPPVTASRTPGGSRGRRREEEPKSEEKAPGRFDVQGLSLRIFDVSAFLRMGAEKHLMKPS